MHLYCNRSHFLSASANLYDFQQVMFCHCVVKLETSNSLMHFNQILPYGKSLAVEKQVDFWSKSFSVIEKRPKDKK